MSRRQHAFNSFGHPAIRRCNWCLEIEGEHSEHCHTRESLLEDVQALTAENKKLTDFSRGLVAINLTMADQVSELAEALEKSKNDGEITASNLENSLRYIKELLAAQDVKSTNEAFYRQQFTKSQEVLEKLTAENKKLKAEANSGWFVTVGETPHETELKLRGDFESIKAAQAIIIERDRLRIELRSKQQALDCLYQANKNLKKQNRELETSQATESNRQRSNAWGEVHSVLTEVAPSWHKGQDSGTNLACATIRNLAADAKNFRALHQAYFTSRDTGINQQGRIFTKVEADITGMLTENVFYYFPSGQPK